MKQPIWKKPDALEAEVRALLAAPLEDAELRKHLETLAAEPAFNGLTWLWGPALYRRRHVLFRPFILNHFSTTQWTGGRFVPTREVFWEGPWQKDLEWWLAEVEANEDATLFRRLYHWKTSSPRWRKRGGVEREVRSLLTAPLEDDALLVRLEILGYSVAPLIWLWGPAVYRRNRDRFRPFILSQFGTAYFWLPGCSGPRLAVRWEGERGAALDAWLAEVEAVGDADLFRQLYRWKMHSRCWDKPRVLEAELRTLLASSLDDAALRLRLEVLAEAPAFPRFVWLWGPELYHRNRLFFRPFLLTHCAHRDRVPPGFGESGWRQSERLESWLNEVDADDDLELFYSLYLWKIESLHWVRELRWRRWQRDLLERFRAAEPEQRPQVLAKFNVGYPLGNTVAAELYRTDPEASRAFILERLAGRWFLGGEWGGSFPEELCSATRARGDEKLFFTVYRRRVSIRQWKEDALRLCAEVSSPGELVDALEKRHPTTGGDLGRVFHRLLTLRGADALPYVMRHLRDVRSGWFCSYRRLRRLALEQEWREFYTELLRARGSRGEYEQEIRRLLDEGNLSREEVLQRLHDLGGAAGGTLNQLSDATAATLYQRYPDLLRGPFRYQLGNLWWDSYPRLADAILAAGDSVLIDQIAARAILQERSGLWGLPKLVDRLAEHYGYVLREDPAEFAWRAASVLGQVPAYSVGNYNRLIRTNRLARMLFERSASAHLTSPQLVRDLLEAPQIYVQALALRTLGLDDEQARTLAAENLDLLLPTLLRSLHRRTRLLAFRALRNAAVTPEAARLIVARARDALDLPEKKYPREQLIGLIGWLLRRWPELRNPGERPTVFERSTP